jgi:hypothetical protein
MLELAPLLRGRIEPQAPWYSLAPSSLKRVSGFEGTPP